MIIGPFISILLDLRAHHGLPIIKLWNLRVHENNNTNVIVSEGPCSPVTILLDLRANGIP